MAKFIVRKCHHERKQNFISIIVQELKWMAIMMVSHAKSNGAVTDPNLWSDSGGNRDQTTILTCFQQNNAPDKPVIIALCA